ncbi:hypothetical protein [Achromobacter deleyi]|uniref:hypothetical protein n=1 Tax=Achromobacter deleyi TaxID=1353891 RepID=UPI001465176A|nr:hypothetical protein [Achromobacter deleyi]CAB3928445.1 hypothetical protein LMG3412_06197 [Achromobacter deleyi]
MAKKPQTPAAEPQDQTQPTAPAQPPEAAVAQQQAPAAPLAPVEPTQPTAPPVPPADPVPAEPLGTFITRHEEAAMTLGIVVTLITHPDATDCVHAGHYGGIRLAPGDALATYSDGTQQE